MSYVPTTLAQARELAASGRPQVASAAGGRSRHIRYRAEGDAVIVRLYDTDIARMDARGVQIWTGGHNTLTTFEALNGLLPGGPALFNRKRVPYWRGERMTEGMIIGWDGQLVEHGATETPLRKARSAR